MSDPQKMADAARRAAKEEIKARSIKMQEDLNSLLPELVRQQLAPVRAELADMQARMLRRENPAAVVAAEPAGDDASGD
ncbi:hypothetical protein [Novosphingobium sp.]|uniref:hypothetical protein n=1 Tax=Novosphingobium sp. TaxID=1874826 RepID=UPI00286E1686|nr:hypothetical protein [Novosphingobium sp.]